METRRRRDEARQAAHEEGYSPTEDTSKHGPRSVAQGAADGNREVEEAVGDVALMRREKI